MSRSCSTHRIPRGFIDPIESRADALAVLSLTAPFGNDTVAILLDPERRGVGILVVTGTTDPDAIFRVIDVCVHARYTDIGGLILAEIESLAREEGLTRLVLETGHAHEPAWRVYERGGFTRCRPVLDYPDTGWSVFYEKLL